MKFEIWKHLYAREKKSSYGSWLDEERNATREKICRNYIFAIDAKQVTHLKFVITIFHLSSSSVSNFTALYCVQILPQVQAEVYEFPSMNLVKPSRNEACSLTMKSNVSKEWLHERHYVHGKKR